MKTVSKNKEYGFQFYDGPERRKKRTEKKNVEVEPERPNQLPIEPASLDLKFEHVLVQFTNDIYEKVYRDSNFNLADIELLLILNLEQKFNRTETAKIMGLSIRTIRNKMNGTGPK